MDIPYIVNALPGELVLTYWQRRLHQHMQDRYRGRSLCKMPEDLRTYQHVIDASKPDVIVELGTHHGGSAIWFADQMATFCGGGRVITVDMNVLPNPPEDDRIEYITGDLCDVSEQVRSMIRPGERVMVSDDSNHQYKSTSDALRLYAPLVTPGCWFVVEDGIVDYPEISIWNVPGGVAKAIEEFLWSPEGERFERYDLSIYGLTTCQNGWLEAKS